MSSSTHRLRIQINNKYLGGTGSIELEYDGPGGPALHVDAPWGHDSWGVK